MTTNEPARAELVAAESAGLLATLNDENARGAPLVVVSSVVARHCCDEVERD
jgi:hypothetical protein